MSSQTPDLNALHSTIQKLPAELQAEAIAELKNAADAIAALAQMFCRVDSGALRDSIHVEQNGENFIVKAGGATAPHAPIIEAKYPFLKPAVDAMKPQIDAALNKLMEAKLGNVTGSK